MLVTFGTTTVLFSSVKIQTVSVLKRQQEAIHKEQADVFSKLHFSVHTKALRSEVLISMPRDPKEIENVPAISSSHSLINLANLESPCTKEAPASSAAFAVWYSSSFIQAVLAKRVISSFIFFMQVEVQTAMLNNSMRWRTTFSDILIHESGNVKLKWIDPSIVQK